jgi:hypothetical protein
VLQVLVHEGDRHAALAHARGDVPPPAQGTLRVQRGGSWEDDREAGLATTRRVGDDPESTGAHAGVRCARDPVPARVDPDRGDGLLVLLARETPDAGSVVADTGAGEVGGP